MSFAGMNIWNCVSGTVKDNPNTDGVIIEYRSPASHSGQHPSGYKIAQKNRDLPLAGPNFSVIGVGTDLPDLGLEGL